MTIKKQRVFKDKNKSRREKRERERAVLRMYGVEEPYCGRQAVFDTALPLLLKARNVLFHDTDKDCAIYAEISPRTLKIWLSKGRDGLMGERGEDYPAFVISFDKSIKESTGMVRASLFQEATLGDAKAAASYLLLYDKRTTKAKEVRIRAKELKAGQTIVIKPSGRKRK